MCDPYSITYAIATAASLYAADENADYQEAANEVANDYSENQHDINQGILTQQQAETQESEARDILQIRQVASEEQATAKAQADAAGIAGNSVSEQLAAFKLQEESHIERLRRVSDLKISSLDANKRGQQVAQSLNSFRLTQDVPGVSLLEGALQTGLAGYGAYLQTPQHQERRAAKKGNSNPKG